MDKRIFWAVLGVIAAALVVMAFMFRYEPLTINGGNGPAMQLWDRWGHRLCLVIPGSKVMCTADELRSSDNFDLSTAKPVK